MRTTMFFTLLMTGCSALALAQTNAQARVFQTKPPVARQASAMTLERAVYLEQTAGDLDGAIMIYRQLMVSAAEDEATRLEAGRHLKAAYVAKSGAAEAQRDLQMDLLTMPAGGAAPSTAELQRRSGLLQQLLQGGKTSGELQGSHYRHAKTGVEFDLPSGWALSSEASAGSGGDTLELSGTGLQATVSIVARKSSPELIEQGIKGAVGRSARHLLDEDYTFKVRWDDVKEMVVTGHRAIAYTADLVEMGPQKPRSQYTVDIITPNTTLHVQGRIATSDLATLRSAIDNMVWGAKIP